MKYGEIIAELREKRGLSQGEVAAKIGSTRAAISHYETNRRQPDSRILSKLADLFNVTTDYIMGRTSNPGTDSSGDVSDFVNHLELSDQAILEKYEFTVDGRKLTEEETRRFIAFVRAERAMKE